MIFADKFAAVNICDETFVFLQDFLIFEETEKSLP